MCLLHCTINLHWYVLSACNTILFSALISYALGWMAQSLIWHKMLWYPKNHFSMSINITSPRFKSRFRINALCYEYYVSNQQNYEQVKKYYNRSKNHERWGMCVRTIKNTLLVAASDLQKRLDARVCLYRVEAKWELVDGIDRRNK